MSNRILTYGNLSTFAAELKVKYAKQTALEALQTKVSALEVVGGQANVLEGVKVNGTALTIAEKMVDILVATGTENGTISVNNANIAVAGLQALAYKAQVSEADLDAALKAVLDAKASGADLTALAGRVTTAEGDITTLKGAATVEGSVDYKIAQAFAALTGNDTEIKTLQALVDWVDEHATDALELSNQVATNKTDIAKNKEDIAKNASDIVALTTLVGTLPEGATSTTVVGYIAEAIAALGIGDYAKTTEVTAAINTALASYYTKTEIDNKFALYSTTEQMNAAIKVVDDKFDNYSTTAQMNEAIGVVDDKFDNYSTTTQMNDAIGVVDAKFANYVLKTDVGTVTSAEVKALLAE